MEGKFKHKQYDLKHSVYHYEEYKIPAKSDFYIYNIDIITLFRNYKVYKNICRETKDIWSLHRITEVKVASWLDRLPISLLLPSILSISPFTCHSPSASGYVGEHVTLFLSEQPITMPECCYVVEEILCKL